MRISDWSSDVCSSDLPARDLGAAGLGEAPQLGEVGDRHDPGHDRDVDAERARVVDEAEVGVGAVEVLGDRAVGAGVDLAPEVAQVDMRVVGLRIALGIAAAPDLERSYGRRGGKECIRQCLLVRLQAIYKKRLTKTRYYT